MGFRAFLQKSAYFAVAGIAYLASYVTPVIGDTIESCLRCDVNRDGIVDILDMNIVGKYFGQTVFTSLEPDPDVNEDGVVNILDLAMVGKNYGKKADHRPVIELDGEVFDAQLTFDGPVHTAYDYEISLPDVIGNKSQFAISARVYDPDNTTKHPDADSVTVTVEQLDGAGKLAKEYVSRTPTTILSPSFVATQGNEIFQTDIEIEWPAHYWYRITAKDSHGEEASALVRYKVKMDNGGRHIETGIYMADIWSEELFQTRSHWGEIVNELSEIGAKWIGTFQPWGYSQIEPLPVIGPMPNLGVNVHTLSNDDLSFVISEETNGGFNSCLLPQLDANIDLNTQRVLDIPFNDITRKHRSSEYWDVWFEQYRSFILPLADLAEKSGVNMLYVLDTSSVLSYYDVQTNDYPLTSRWRALIQEVRDRYSGLLGIGQPVFWLGSEQDKHFFMGSSGDIHYYDLLDFVGASFNPSLTNQMDPSIDLLRERMNALLIDMFESTMEETGKPLFLRTIFYSTDGANQGARLLYDPNAQVDMQEQVDEYEAFWQAILTLQYIEKVFSMGYAWSSDFGILDFKTNWSIRDKPAEKVAKLWFEIYGD